MDDTQDKVRRNLVTFSAAIIASSFLNIKFADTPKILGILEVSSISEGRFWILAFAVLTYLSLRYRFDDNTKNIWLNLDEEFRLAARKITERHLRIRLQLDLLRKGRSKILTDNSFLLNFVKDDHADLPEVQRIELTELKLGPANILPNDDGSINRNIWEGRAGMDREYVLRGGSHIASTGGNLASYKIPPLAKAIISTRSMAQVLIYSSSGINLLFPYVIAFVAALVSIYKIFCAYGPSLLQMQTMWFGILSALTP